MVTIVITSGCRWIGPGHPQVVQRTADLAANRGDGAAELVGNSRVVKVDEVAQDDRRALPGRQAAHCSDQPVAIGHRVLLVAHRGLREPFGRDLAPPSTTPARGREVDHDAAGVRRRMVGGSNLRPGPPHPEQGGLKEILGRRGIRGQHPGQPREVGGRVGHEGREVIGARVPHKDKDSLTQPNIASESVLVRAGRYVALMITERAELPVLPGREAEFEETFGRAKLIISAMPGFIGLTLSRCIERPSTYLLLVHWRTLEDHTDGFRGSPEYQEWRSLLHHFYDPFPVVEHFAEVDRA